MTVLSIRELIAMFGYKDPRKVLDASRDLFRSTGSNQSPLANNTRLYCTIVSSLCAIKLTGPSSQIANALAGASHHALQQHNKQLAALALWYAVCCRMMYLYPQDTVAEPPNAHDLSQLSGELRLLAARAAQANDAELVAVTASVILEVAIRTDASESEISTALTFADQKMQEVSDRGVAGMRTSRVLHRLAFNMGVAEKRGPYYIATHVRYQDLLYVPHELTATIK